MATITVDTDGVSGDHANLNAALGALADPFTEAMIISCDASTGVKDTTDASGIIIDTTTNYTLTIVGTDDYIFSPADANKLGFDQAFGNFYNIIIDGVNFEKPSQSANYQPTIEILNIRDGDIIIKNSRVISNSGITNRERMIHLATNVSFNAEIFLINNYLRTKGSATHTATGCIAHISDSPVFVYNNTIIGQQANYNNAANALYINNIIQTITSTYTVSASSNYNMFSGAFDFGGAQDEQSQTFVFEDLSSDDVHLDSTDTGARGKGTDLSSDANFPFDYDQDGV